MDYDKTDMPAAYDAGRAYSPTALAHWLDIIAPWVPKRTGVEFLDLGCGTGRYSEALAVRFDARVTAVDPSEKMLAQARKKATGRVRYERGSGELLPLADESVDVVFMSMVFHHFREPVQVVRECHRVLKPGGAVCLRAGTSDEIDGCAYLPFFKETRPVLLRALQSRATIPRHDPFHLCRTAVYVGAP
jgi:ubiquinone/menaquinone biosynthesis C-methylase UbiE